MDALTFFGLLREMSNFLFGNRDDLSLIDRIRIIILFLVLITVMGFLMLLMAIAVYSVLQSAISEPNTRNYMGLAIAIILFGGSFTWNVLRVENIKFKLEEKEKERLKNLEREFIYGQEYFKKEQEKSKIVANALEFYMRDNNLSGQEVISEISKRLSRENNGETDRDIQYLTDNIVQKATEKRG